MSVQDSEEEEWEEVLEEEEGEERWDERYVEAVLGGGDAVHRGAAVNTSEAEEEEMDDMDVAMASKQVPLYIVGSYVAAVYDDKWYTGQVEAEKHENECP